MALFAPTRAEPGCLRYDLYQSPTKKNEFMRLEVWRDSAALEAHKQTPHILASFKKRQEQGWQTQERRDNKMTTTRKIVTIAICCVLISVASAVAQEVGVTERARRRVVAGIGGNLRSARARG